MNDLGQRHSGTSQHIAWWFSPFILIVVTIGVMSPLIGAGFTDWDDQQTVAVNPAFNPPTFGAVMRFWDPRRPYMDIYDPVTNCVWGVLAKIGPRRVADAEGVTLSAMPFHVANILVHAISAIFVLLILRRVGVKELAALVGALVFAIHPVQVEAVGWVSGMKDVLSGMLALMAIWFYVGAVQRRSGGRYAVATIVFVLAMCAKPASGCLPVVVAVMDWVLLRRRAGEVLKWVVPWVVLAIPIVWIGHHAQPAGFVNSPRMLRPIVAGDAMAFYLGKILWPVQLGVDYGRSPYWLMHLEQRGWVWGIAMEVVGLVVIGGVALAWNGFRKSAKKSAPTVRPLHGVIAAVGIFVGALLPVLGFVRFDFQVYSTVADHYLYLAMLGVALVVGMGLSAVRWRKWVAPVVLVLAAMGCLSAHQCGFWKSTMTLMTRALEVNPASLAGNNVLGMHYDQMRPADVVEAGPYFERAVAEHPNVAWVHFNAANYLMHAGNVDAAIKQFRDAIRLDGNKADYFLNYGAALGMAGKDEQAIAAFEAALRITAKEVRAAEEIGAFAEAKRINAKGARADQNIGAIWARRGDEGKATQFYRKAVEIDPELEGAWEWLREHSEETR